MRKHRVSTNAGQLHYVHVSEAVNRDVGDTGSCAGIAEGFTDRVPPWNRIGVYPVESGTVPTGVTAEDAPGLRLFALPLMERV